MPLSLFDAQIIAVCDGPHAGAMLCVYNAWFRQSPAGNLKKSFDFSLSLVRTCIRFMTGCLSSPSVTGRISGTPIGPCKASLEMFACGSDAICDEYHLVSKYPALANLCHEYSCLFKNHAFPMRLFVWQEDTLQNRKFV